MTSQWGRNTIYPEEWDLTNEYRRQEFYPRVGGSKSVANEWDDQMGDMIIPKNIHVAIQ